MPQIFRANKILVTPWSAIDSDTFSVMLVKSVKAMEEEFFLQADTTGPTLKFIELFVFSCNMANFQGIIILKGLLTFMNRTSPWRGFGDTFIYRNSFITVGLSNWEF